MGPKTRIRVAAAAGLGLIGLLTVAVVGAGSTSNGTTTSPGANPGPNPPAEIRHDVSPPLSTIPPKPPRGGRREHPEHPIPLPPSSGARDPVVQTSPGSASAPALGLGFEGVGNGFTGPAGTFSVDSAPPDPNGAVGPSNYMEVVNESLAIFNKSGTPIYGPVPTNTIWSGFGGGCETNDDGDATVEYDKLANRWIVSQFSVSTTPYLQCVAVSTTGNPTGPYYRYEFGGFGNNF